MSIVIEGEVTKNVSVFWIKKKNADFTIYDW